MNEKMSWRYLKPEERYERYEELEFPDDVEFFYRQGSLEVNLPMKLLHEVLDKFIQHGYVTFSIDLFHEDGLAVISAMMPRDHAVGEEVSIDWV